MFLSLSLSLSHSIAGSNKNPPFTLHADAEPTSDLTPTPSLKPPTTPEPPPPPSKFLYQSSTTDHSNSFD